MFQVGDRARIVEGHGKWSGACGTIIATWQSTRGPGYWLKPDPEFTYISREPSWNFYEADFELIDGSTVDAYMELFI